MEINGTKNLIFKFSDTYEEITDEIITIPEQKNLIDLSPFILEFITLLVPLRRVHPDDSNGHSLCNPEVLKILKAHSEEKAIDIRWNKLKELLN
ncbi:MAG TPA: DUF177 domain-containing protein [Bacteroidales bacterium]|nr:DUF177 domain-containing protein [Bacteroidales bacterium]